MQVTLIVLFAHWCSKCNMMMPVVDEIEEVYKEQLEVVRIDICLLYTSDAADEKKLKLQKIIVSKLYQHLL